MPRGPHTTDRTWTTYNLPTRLTAPAAVAGDADKDNDFQMSLDSEAGVPAWVDAWSEAARKVRKDVIVLVHGGPVSEPEDAAYVLRETKNCHGFYGASSMERLPTERALVEQTKRFKAIQRP